jgi:hypothetical protein
MATRLPIRLLRKEVPLTGETKNLYSQNQRPGALLICNLEKPGNQVERTEKSLAIKDLFARPKQIKRF